jgi:GNAT superfamily N-acetyltransferase
VPEVPEVTVRDAQKGDAASIGDIWSSAVPYLIRTGARAAADMREDRTLRRRRWVGIVDNVVAGTATARQVGEREVFVTVEVHPEHGSRGVGTALLMTAVNAFPGTSMLRSVSNGDPISMSFAVRNGFLPEGEHHIAFIDPATVDAVEPAPRDLRPVTLDALPDLRMLLETYNLSAVDDPSGLSRRYTMYQLRADWWDSPDNAPDLSFGLVDDTTPRPLLASFTSVQVDRQRGRSWSSMTATHPSYRGRGLATWVKHRMLNALVEAAITEAWTGNDAMNKPMLRVNETLGYQPAATSIRLARRLPG